MMGQPGDVFDGARMGVAQGGGEWIPIALMGSRAP
jgi:hypothetical protein